MNEKGTNFCSFSVRLEPATPAYETNTQSTPRPYLYLIDSVNCPPTLLTQPIIHECTIMLHRWLPTLKIWKRAGNYWCKLCVHMYMIGCTRGPVDVSCTSVWLMSV